MKRIALTTLAVLGVAAALAVTASSTSEQAYLAGMRGLALGGLVVLLEVINVSGTWVWLTDPRRNVRIEAGFGVGVASLITGICGWLSYGAIGAAAPAGLLFAVHLCYRLNQPADQTETTTAARDSQDDHLRAIVAEPVVDEPEPQVWSGPDTVELPRAEDTRPVEVVAEPVQLKSVDWSVDQIVAQLHEQGRTDPDQRGLQRYIRDTYGVGPAKATKAIDALRPSEVAS